MILKMGFDMKNEIYTQYLDQLVIIGISKGAEEIYKYRATLESKGLQLPEIENLISDSIDRVEEIEFISKRNKANNILQFTNKS